MTGSNLSTGLIASFALLAATPGLGQPHARSDHAEAAYRLGRAYKMGDGVAADTREAERLLGKAASAGHAKAGAEYGLVLMHNDKPAEAIPWLRKAAADGDARAQYALGSLLFAGRGVKLDRAEARRWLARAARAGLPAAKEALQIIDAPTVIADAATITNDAVVSAAVKPAPTQAPWRAQLGAFAKPENAKRYWRQIKEAGGPNASFEEAGRLTLLRAGPFDTRAAATSYCAAQRRQGRDCLVVE